MTQYAKVVLLGTAAIFIDLLICAIIITYIWISIRSSSAAGLFWRFSRDRKPIFFWLQLALVFTIVPYLFVEIGYVIATLVAVS